MPTIRNKSDVETRWEHGREYPCVNVKVHNGIRRADLEAVERESGLAGFADWAQDLLDADKWPEWTWEAACEQGWETLKSNADECFPGQGVKVYSAGRSGGWCIVEGLPPVESWDAIMLGKWRRFAKWARLQADDIPHAMADLAAFNVYEPAKDEASK